MKGSLDESWARLCDLSAQGFGIYACPQDGTWPMLHGMPSGRAAHVTRWRAWYADCDSRESSDALRALPQNALPSMVVATSLRADGSPKLQAFWLADEPGNASAMAELGARAILHIGGDPKAMDAVRVLRVPGFPNTKPLAADFMVRVLGADPSRRWTPQTFAALWPDATVPDPKDPGLPPGESAKILRELASRLDAEPALRALRARMTADVIASTPPPTFNTSTSDGDIHQMACRMRDLGWTDPDGMTAALTDWFNAATDGMPEKGRNADMGNVAYLRAKCVNALRYGQGVPGATLVDAYDVANMDFGDGDNGGADAPAKKDPDAGVRPPGSSEQELAEWLIRWKLSAKAPGDDDKAVVAPLADGGLIRRWDPATGAWLPVSEKELLRHSACRSALPAMHDKTGNKGGAVLRPLRMSDRMVKSVALAIRRHVYVCTADDAWEDSASGICFAGQIAEIGEGGAVTIRPALPEDRARIGFPWEWPGLPPRNGHDPPWLDIPNAPLFSRLLRSCIGPDSEKHPGRAEATARVLACFVGSCMLGIAPQWEKAIMVQGKAGVGKSSVLSVLRKLFPPEDVAAIPLHKWADEKYVVQLAGRRINMIGDDRGAETLEESDFKSIVSAGDEITARDLYKSVIKFAPACGHILMRNKLPHTKDQTDGFWRRWILLRFEGGVPENERIPPPELLSAIVSEMPSIAAWAVRGASWIVANRGYGDVPGMREAMDAWKEDSDQVAQFARGACGPCDVTDDRALTPAGLMTHYRIWTEIMGHKMMGNRTLTNRLMDLGFVSGRRKGEQRRWPLYAKNQDDWDGSDGQADMRATTAEAAP